MIVALSKKVRILAEDGRCFALVHLVERVKKSTGEKYEDWESVGYYGTLRQAAQAALQKELFRLPGTVVKVGELVAALDRGSARIAEACDGAMEAAALAELEGLEGAPEVPEELFDAVPA